MSPLRIGLTAYAPLITVRIAVRISEFVFPDTSGIRTRTAGRSAMGAASARSVFEAIAAHDSLLLAGWEPAILLRTDSMFVSRFLIGFSLCFAVFQRALARAIASFSIVVMPPRANSEISFSYFSRTP